MRRRGLALTAEGETVSARGLAARRDSLQRLLEDVPGEHRASLVSAVEAMLADSLEHAFEDVNERVWTETRLKSDEMLGAVESAVAQPQMTFGGKDLYFTLADKAAALGFSLVMNHPFVDGNKRIGHAAI